MRLLTHMLKAFVRVGTLTVIDANGRRHVFAGAPGPSVTMRLTDRALYRKLALNPELHAGEAYMDGTLCFEEGSALRDFLTLFSVNRLSLGSYPLSGRCGGCRARSGASSRRTRWAGRAATWPITTISATISTNSSWMRGCSIPAPTSCTTTKRWKRPSGTSCA